MARRLKLTTRQAAGARVVRNQEAALGVGSQNPPECSETCRQSMQMEKVMAASPLRSMASGDLSFAHVLHASGPDRERTEKLALYGWLVGDWEMDVTTFPEDGTRHEGQGEIHAGWVLEGRAIQDVWMIPRLESRKPAIDQLPGAGNWYGTTLRIYDPALDAWRILWSDPATGFFTQQIGRARGEDIIQLGPDPRGGTMRWTFTEIDRSMKSGPTSFHWMAERSPDDENWRQEVDIRARFRGHRS